MNKVFLIGNLTKDVELTETAGGAAVCRFSIAVNRPYTTDGERQTDFFTCTAWRVLAETIAKYCKKGDKVAVVGSVQTRNYEDNQGIKRMAIDIIVQDCEFLTPKTGENEEKGESRAISQGGKKKPILTESNDDSDIPF